ncbi:cyanate transporter [Methylobacterium radiodurans]|uniref:MFS transporter n=1 Tax=Methylobacterium radiodurans TaxID=2202828 RepID=A0A2U8VN64_9HYPH|nr:cyanate transporter [Methylobacterium radiodurans]AWN35053.1 MFS transporter [Methylobacterium radiodurans]
MTPNGGAAAARLPILLLVILVGLNLRPFLTAVGPLTADIRASIGLSLQGLSLLTLIPMGLMGVLAFVGPTVEAKFGARPALVAALWAVAGGSLARWFVVDAEGMFASTVVLSVGVAVAQVVFPGVLKRQFPNGLSTVMGLYSAMLMGGGAAGARLAPLVAETIGDWRAGLGLLAAPAALAAIAAALILPRSDRREERAIPAVGLLRRPRTWLLMACFGLVNGGYSTVVTWLAPFYQERGWSVGSSGTLLAVMALSQGAAALLLPMVSRHARDRRGWLWFTLALQAFGFLGLAAAPDLAPMIWAVGVGAGLGSSFALTMVVSLDHSPDPAAAGALTAMMQGGGFLLAAVAPWLVALLHDLSGGYTAGWIMHLGNVMVVACLTTRLAPGTYRRALGMAVPSPAE